MKRDTIIYLCLGLSILFLPSCEKGDEYDSSAYTNFNALWQILDENYCFFDYKDIDWDDVYDQYLPQLSDTMTVYTLFDTLGDMLAELKDGHVNLISTFNTSRYWDWYLDYADNFSEDIQENYLGRDYSIAGGLRYTTLADGQIGYIYYGSFSSSASDASLTHIFYQFSECKGIIFDVRDNSGGLLSNADRIASHFISEECLVGYIQYKTGKGHSDLSDPYPIYLSPSEYSRWLRPVVVLTNRYCYSAANNFVQKMRTFSNVVTMGDRTGGGSGMPYSSELPNGWAIRFSASPLLDENQQHTEFGIDPDIAVSMTEEDEAEGKDTIIETAISYILAETSDEDTEEGLE